MLRFESETFQIMKNIGDLIQIKQIELDTLRAAYKKIQTQGMRDVGVDPSKNYSILPDGRFFEDPDIAPQSEAIPTLIAFPSVLDEADANQ